MENTKENNNKNKPTTKPEKKVLIYILIITIILVHFSTYFINEIADRETIKDTKSVAITEKDNKKDNQNIDNNNNINNNNNKNPNSNIDSSNNINPNNNIDQNTNIDSNNVVDNNDRFRILQGTKQWSELKELDMFKNSYFKGEKKIAPGVSDSYNFTVENNGDSEIKYDIIFTEENPYNINMVFKLKLNGKYISGNESTWVSDKDFNQKDKIIQPLTNDIYTIEWKWEDAENDTQIGQTEGAYYKMNANAFAQEIN